MKKKKIFAIVAIIALIATLTVSTSAFEFKEPVYTASVVNAPPTMQEVDFMLETLEYQLQMNMGMSRGRTIFYIGYNPDGGDFYAIVSNAGSVTKKSSNGSVITFEFSETAYRLYWNAETGFYENTKTSVWTAYTQYVYYASFDYPATSMAGFKGKNPNAVYGTGDFGAKNVFEYYQTIYDRVIGYEDAIEAAEQDGYEIGLDHGYDAGYEAGYQTGVDDTHDTAYNEGFMDGKGEGFTQGYNQGKTDGKTECESTHQTLQEQAYDDGYDMGQEQCEKTHNEIRQAGYDNGLYDCEQTHEAMKREQYEEGWSEGHATGVNEGYETGYEEGYEEGDYDGFNRGFDDGMLEAEKLTGEMLQSKYNQGFTDGEQSVLETSKVVTDYVDSLFSAPLNFLYTMLDVEVFGINVFGIAAALLALAVVLVVVKIILKVKG